MGHCKNYAETIASRIDCDYFDIKKINYKSMKDKDIIIFIGPVNNNKIKKIDNFLKYYKKIKDKNLIIIAVGMQPKSQERRESIIITNILDNYHVRLYELMGGIDLTKLSKLKQKIIKIGFDVALKKDPSMSAYKERVTTLLEHPYDFYDYDGIDIIVNKIRNIERIV